jgi:ATP-dependent helicase/nuclease subunit A
MTRAAERLVVCGIKGDRRIPDGCWYQLVDNALGEIAVREAADDKIGDGEGTVRRFRKTDPHAAAETEAEPRAASPEKTEPAIIVPDWLRRDAPRDVTPRIITPSGFDESARRPLPVNGQNKAQNLAMLRGSLTHRLLQSLPGIPGERRLKAAQDYVAREGKKLAAADHAPLIADVMRVLDDARFGALFGPGSRAEVPIVGLVDVGGETRRVNGQVDRLVVTADWVLIADYKTNRPAPRTLTEVPPAYVRQLALYRAVLAKLYPDKVVRCALIWTEVPDLMELSAEALTHALAAVTSPRSAP